MLILFYDMLRTSVLKALSDSKTRMKMQILNNAVADEKNGRIKKPINRI